MIICHFFYLPKKLIIVLIKKSFIQKKEKGVKLHTVETKLTKSQF